MTNSTSRLDQARGDLHEIIRKDLLFDQKAREALHLAREYLAADVGYLTRIDPETNHWEVTVSTDTADGRIPPGEERDLTDTYCRKTIEEDGPLTIHDAPSQGWVNDPAFESEEFHTYLGIPLILDGEAYGTVCFVAEEPRAEPFSDADSRFIEDLTRLLERDLERERAAAELTSQTKLAAVLNRVLRHNLRNDITVIRGQTQRLAETLEDDSAFETILDHIDALIELSEKARELERIVTSDIERRPTAIGTLVEDVADTIRRDHPHASITVEYDSDISASLRPEFDRAVRELIGNAVQHSGENPTVSVHIQNVPNAVEIAIRDDGPGLPEQEAEVLSSGEESPLSHGSGLGLWLAHWIVTNHDGSIGHEVTENGTTITLTIPRTPDVNHHQQKTEVTRGFDRFQAAFEEANDAIVLLNDDGRIVNSNPRAGAIFGLDSEALLGRSLAEFLPRSDFETEWRELHNTGAIRGTITVAHAEGVERTVEYSAKADIVPGEHLVVSRDITKRKEREREIQRGRDRFQSVFDGAFDAMVIANDEGEIIDVNESATALFGCAEDELVGQSIRDFAPEDFDFEEAWTEFNQSDQERGTFPLVRSDGRRRTVEYAATTDIYPGQHLSILRDITERMEREQELSSLKERYETLLEAAPEPVFVADARSGEIIETNAAAETLLGKSSDDVVGMAQSDLHPSDDGELYRELFEEHVKTGGTRRKLPDGSPIHMVTDDGKQIPVEISVAKVSLPDGPVVFGIFRDISDRMDATGNPEPLQDR